MVTGKEWIRGGFEPVEQLKGLIALLEQHYAEAGGCADPAIVAIIAARIEGAARSLADDAAA